MTSNPIVRKELLLRFRLRQKSLANISLIVAVVLCVLYLYYVALDILISEPRTAAGRDLCDVVLILQTLIICGLAPACTANAIAQEKEQQTWDMLLVSRLKPTEIIFGKLLSRCAPLFGIMLLGLPVVLLGWWKSNSGIMPDGQSGHFPLVNIALTYLATTVLALFFAVFALYMSFRLKRTLYALITSYAFIVGGLCAGTALVTASLQMFAGYNSHFDKLFPLMWINPVYTYVEVMSHWDNSGEYTGFGIFGLFLYVLATLFLLRSMVKNFRKFSYEK